jgi:hypothetical protein
LVLVDSIIPKKGGHCFFIRKNSETLTNKTFESIDI